ncbi:hypothetical protein L596_006564 [Steinernema carpocapsae]|uniref:Uncharacterized protein n=1 Tax=Steinernema carpocapsae TaxID=34508 RepID=A0A4U8V4R7_STECR|nr:hypothetical protein L596_006564 [Steinernema carpocapsae]
MLNGLPNAQLTEFELETLQDGHAIYPVHDNWSAPTGRRQLVSANWSETTGRRQLVGANWSETTGQRQLVGDNWSAPASLAPRTTTFKIAYPKPKMLQ